jgi:hypothetical protein
MTRIFSSHCIFSEWRFHVGSFCLVRNQGLEGVPPEECTRDRYWKARIIEIRRPGRKRNASSNPASRESFEPNYLTSYCFRNTIYRYNGFTARKTLSWSCLRVLKPWIGNIVTLRSCHSTHIVFNQVFGEWG